MNLDNLEKILTKFATAKGVVVIVIAAVLVFFVIKNFDFISKVTFEISPDKTVKKDPQFHAIPHDIQLRRVQIPPVLLDVPPYFFAEFANRNRLPAKNVEFLIDLGASKQERVAVRPKDRCSIVSQEDISLIRVRCTSLNGGESVFVQAVLTHPLYRRITITLNGENAHEITASNHFDSFPSDLTFPSLVVGGLELFALIVGGLILTIFGYYIIRLVVRLCERFVGGASADNGGAKSDKAGRK